MKERLFKILEPPENNDKTSKFFDVFIIILITLNILSIILESFNSLKIHYNAIFKTFEVISVIIFSIEYLARVYISDLKYKEKNKLKSRLFFMITPMAIIDLMAILPFYIPFLIPVDLRFLRMFRIFRVFRIFKLNRYSKSMNLIMKVIKKSLDELMATVFILIMLILLSATMIYYAETGAQPEEFPNIINTLWWAVCTLTTVGYGDVYPITSLGKILTSIISILGIGLVALPTGIISSGFIAEVQTKKETICPNCGEKISEN
ncbi:MAG: ion transporter [Bacillota bacterium]|nr:ion transporter [Bacillota bacterium]